MLHSAWYSVPSTSAITRLGEPGRHFYVGETRPEVEDLFAYYTIIIYFSQLVEIFEKTSVFSRALFILRFAQKWVFIAQAYD